MRRLEKETQRRRKSYRTVQRRPPPESASAVNVLFE